MQILGHATASATGGTPAFSLGTDMSAVVTEVRTVKDARALPRGAVVGDLHGGLTFSDAIAAVLEKRSTQGWQEFEPAPGGDRWTIIILDR